MSEEPATEISLTLPPGGVDRKHQGFQNTSALACLTCGSACTLASTSAGTVAVDLDQRDGVAARLVAAEMEGRDVDLGVAEQAGEAADEARLVLVGDVDHRLAEFGVDADALDVDQPRLAVGDRPCPETERSWRSVVTVTVIRLS